MQDSHGDSESASAGQVGDVALATEHVAEEPVGVDLLHPARTALVVDDDDMVRSLLTRLLAAAGFHCLQAKNGEQALELLDGHNLQLGVLDIVLPGMSGAELCWLIRTRTPELPLVAVSGCLDVWDPDDLADLGFDHVFAKPFDCDEFIRICGAISTGDATSCEDTATRKH